MDPSCRKSRYILIGLPWNDTYYKLWERCCLKFTFGWRKISVALRKWPFMALLCNITFWKLKNRFRKPIFLNSLLGVRTIWSNRVNLTNSASLPRRIGSLCKKAGLQVATFWCSSVQWLLHFTVLWQYSSTISKPTDWTVCQW